MPVRIVYESHATTTDNEAGIATGWLSPTGRRQAAELGDRRRGTGLDAVYTSDLARAVETARIAFAGAGSPALRLRDVAAEWDGGQVLLIAHSANRWSLDCLLAGARLESVVADPPPWQPGTFYTLP
ncbi:MULTISPECIES: phosphoglycerate mutase family protein [unclassified Streptomyces]|uniref:phosphoglycerate mutase family protein n=1 Tax=unclassified Streptomyces TaxID=2593676 RepID=UPI0003615453|nr:MULTISPECIES: phosphoglycerate mutase family protein [unclassified Streptomyces]MYQ77330.1 histidine phosphatase family protein [Streptomyces sp. SID4923]